MQATQNTTGGQKSVVIIRLCDAQAQKIVNNFPGRDKYSCKEERKLDVD